MARWWRLARSASVGLAFAIVAALTLSVARAAAHAQLAGSIPESNAVLAQAPTQIDLFFTEAVDPAFTTISVLNASAVRVDRRDTRIDPADPTHAIVSLPADLPDGVYIVSWRALSSEDGHVTGSSFPFTVGPATTAAAAAGPAEQEQAQIPPVSLIAKWLVYLAATALAGGPLFVTFVWQPVFQQTGLDVSPTTAWSRGSTVAFGAFFAGWLLYWWSQAGQAAGGLLAAPWQPVAGQLLANTRLGAVWLGQAAVATALAGLLGPASWRRPHQHRLAWNLITLGAAALLLLSLSLASHAAADPEPVVPVLADWVHFWAAAAWSGGLMYFVIGLWSLRSSPLTPQARTQAVARLIPRFSALALTSVALLTLTGVYSAYLRVGSLPALLGTPYGWTLLVKLAVAAPMVVMGAINLLLVTPAMKRAGHAPAGNLSLVSRFRGLVTGEASLSLILLLSVSALTLLPPAQVPVVGLAGSAHADDVQVKLAITPGRSGINTFQIDLLSSGRPVSAQSVAMQFTPTNANLAPSQGQPVATGPGHYQLVGGFLGFPDRWQVVVLVQRPGKYDAFAYFNYTVEAPAAATSPFPWNKVSGLALLGWAITFLSTTMSVSRTWRQRLFAGPVLAIALAVTALAVYLTRAPH